MEECCCQKTKVRTDEEYKSLMNRLNRIEGQIRGLKGMLEKNAYCPDILTQAAAANAAVNAFCKELLADHISELSWGHIRTPGEVVKPGDQIEVFVLKFDPEKKKISLGYKTPEMNPWNQFLAKYSVGDVVTVKIVKLVDFGAFAEIMPGVDGLIHISQISDHRVEKASDALQEGQEVEAKIIDVDTDRKRISLSIRALLVPQNDED